jgi:hypothetical protein
MKKVNLKILAISAMAVIIIFAIFSFAAPVKKIFTSTKDKKDSIHIKIVKEINGKKTVTDTIIYMDDIKDIDALINSKEEFMKKEFDITLNMDSIMTIVNKCLVNLPDMDSIMKVVAINCKDLPDMDSYETIIHQGMVNMPDMDSIMMLVETGMKECPKTIRIIKTDSLNPCCAIFIDDKEIKDHPGGTKIVKDDNKTIIKKCDKGDGNIIVKEIDGKNCKNTHTITCKVIIEDASEKDKNVLKETGDTKEGLKVDKLSFFPNPGTGRFKLSFTTETKGKTEVSIFDANGKEVYKEVITDFNGNYSKEIDISQNPKGAYFLLVKQGKKSMTKKLIVQ